VLGKYFLYGVIAFVAIVLGMILYPTVHTNWVGIDVTGFIPLVKAGMVVLSYGFVFFIAYLIYAHIRK
jgi:hypothetical protein